MKKSLLQIMGMTCKHCTNSVKMTLEELEGVETANVDLDGSAEVSYDETKVDVDKMEKAIEDIPYILLATTDM